MRKVLFIAALLALGPLMVLAQPKPPAPEELKALQEVSVYRFYLDAGQMPPGAKAIDSDEVVAAVEDAIKKFPSTQYKAFALTTEAMAYQWKGDILRAILTYQRILEVDPKDDNAMLMLAAETVRSAGDDVDKEEKLAKAEKYANDAIALIPNLSKSNPQLGDQQWADLQRYDMARGYEALGMIAAARKKYDVAASEFKLATETSAEPQAATFVRLGGAYMDAGKPTDAIAALDKALAMPNVSEQVKRVAQAEKARAEKAQTVKQ